ncbi:hypothetical protein [Acinetobacter towneri]|nr:hypothetical protein [Acinetobacter towneri]
MDFCRSYNAGEIDQQALTAKTVQYGFVNVNRTGFVGDFFI